MTTQHVSEISDRKFFTLLCLVLPIGLGLSILAVAIFIPPYIMVCDKTDQACNTALEIMQMIGFGVSILAGVIGLKIGLKGYRDGSGLYKALDRQNDKCFTCGKIILPDDQFYWDHVSKVFCINHNPFSNDTTQKELK